MNINDVSNEKGTSVIAKEHFNYRKFVIWHLLIIAIDIDAPFCTILN